VKGIPLEAVPFPGSWWRRGACRAVPTEVFFPGRGEATEPAKEVCRACPVRAECRDYAVPVAELKGIWGGLAEVERQRLRRAATSAPPATPPPPPAPVAPGPGGPRRGRKGGLYQALQELTASPGRPARVAWYPGRYSAAGMATRLRNGWASAPAGEWRFEARPSEGGSGLWAVYGGIESPSAESA